MRAVAIPPGWNGVCQCMRCRHPAYRWLYYKGVRVRAIWDRLATCRVKGHNIPGPLSWKTFCQRCGYAPPT